MPGHYLRGRARSAWWAYRCAALSGALLVVSLVFFRLGLLDLQAFAWSVALTAALVATGLLLALVAIAKVWQRGDRGGGRAVAALFLGCVVGLPFALGLALALEYPAGNAAQTAGLETAAVTGTEEDEALQSPIPGRDYRATAAQVFGAARNAAEASGWDIIEVETSSLPFPQDGDLGVSGSVAAPVPTLRDTVDFSAPYDRYAELDADEYLVSALARTPLLGFPSDVTIRITEQDGETFVDARAQSRDLARDLGQNRRFIEGYLLRLDEAMAVLQNVVVED